MTPIFVPAQLKKQGGTELGRSGMRLAAMRTRAMWDRARVSALVPVGLVVAGAILCLVIAVVTSARRADEVALAHDEELFINAIADRRERVLSELESLATTDQAQANILGPAAAEWIDRDVALVLRRHFQHDYRLRRRRRRPAHLSGARRARAGAGLARHDPAGSRSAHRFHPQPRTGCRLHGRSGSHRQSDAAARPPRAFFRRAPGHPCGDPRCVAGSELRRIDGGGTTCPVGEIH